MDEFNDIASAALDLIRCGQILSDGVGPTFYVVCVVENYAMRLLHDFHVNE